MVRDSGADAAALVVDCDKPVVINIQGGHNVVSILLCKSNRQCEQWPVTAFWLCTALLSSPGYVVTTMMGPVLPVLHLRFTRYRGNQLDTRRFCDAESTSLTLIQRRKKRRVLSGKARICVRYNYITILLLT